MIRNGLDRAIAVTGCCFPGDHGLALAHLVRYCGYSQAVERQVVFLVKTGATELLTIFLALELFSFCLYTLAAFHRRINRLAGGYGRPGFRRALTRARSSRSLSHKLRGRGDKRRTGSWGAVAGYGADGGRPPPRRSPTNRVGDVGRQQTSS